MIINKATPIRSKFIFVVADDSCKNEQVSERDQIQLKTKELLKLEETEKSDICRDTLNPKIHSK